MVTDNPCIISGRTFYFSRKAEMWKPPTGSLGSCSPGRGGNRDAWEIAVDFVAHHLDEGFIHLDGAEPRCLYCLLEKKIIYSKSKNPCISEVENKGRRRDGEKTFCALLRLQRSLRWFILDRLRQEHRLQEHETPYSQMEEEELTEWADPRNPSSLQNLLRQEAVDRIESAIRPLEEVNQMIIKSRIEGRMIAEIASDLGMTENAVKRRLFTIRQRLKRWLANDG